MKKTLLIILILVAVALGFASHKETVALGQVGVRSLFGQTTVFAAGETAFVLPVVHQFVLMTTKPVVFPMSGAGALDISRNGTTEMKIECKVRYQIDRPGDFIKAVGSVKPDKILDDRLRAKITEILTKHLEDNDLDLTNIQTRMLVSGETIHTLNDEALSPGVSILSFELLNW